MALGPTLGWMRKGYHCMRNWNVTEGGEASVQNIGRRSYTSKTTNITLYVSLLTREE
jgi:hypothetical protein